MNELVSVIIPTYNRAKRIGRSIRSILAQDYPFFEIIVVDDGSTDGTRERVAAIGDERIRYEYLPHRGACAARNKGIELARGAYIAFQDSDDVWLPHKLSTQIERLRTAGCDIVFCAFERIRDRIDWLSRYAIYPDGLPDGTTLRPEMILTSNLMSTQTVLGKTECFRREKWDEDMPRLQDWEYALRLCGAYDVRFFFDVLCVQEVQKDSLSTRGDLLAPALEKLLAKHADLYAEHEDAVDEVRALIETSRPGTAPTGWRDRPLVRKTRIRCRRCADRISRTASALTAKVRNARIRSGFADLPAFAGKTVDENGGNSGLPPFIYRDDGWHHVRTFFLQDWFLRELPDPWQMKDESGPARFSAEDDRISIDSAGRRDHWCCFFWRGACKTDFSFSCTVDTAGNDVPDEIQISFFCKDLRDRWRFMIREGKTAVFDVIRNGTFLKNIRRVELPEFARSPSHTIRVGVVGKKLCFLVDGTNVFSLRAKIRRPEGKDLALIFYNRTAEKDVRLTVSDIRLTDGE